MAFWTTEDVTTITTYLDGLTITSSDDWAEAWPGPEDAAIQVADIDLNGAVVNLTVNESDTEVTVNIVYNNSETVEEETEALVFTTAEISKTWTIATE